MGLLQYLGLDDLADSVNELTTGFEELRDEIVTSVIGPGEELKSTISDITGSITSGEPISPNAADTPIDETPSN
jgi:hypothetical protein